MNSLNFMKKILNISLAEHLNTNIIVTDLLNNSIMAQEDDTSDIIEILNNSGRKFSTFQSITFSKHLKSFNLKGNIWNWSSS